MIGDTGAGLSARETSVDLFGLQRTTSSPRSKTSSPSASSARSQRGPNHLHVTHTRLASFLGDDAMVPCIYGVERPCLPLDAAASTPATPEVVERVNRVPAVVLQRA